MTGREWGRLRRVQRAGLELLVVTVMLTVVTSVIVQLRAAAMSAALLYMLLVVVVSLSGRIVPALFAGVGALLALNYYFTPPLHSIAVHDSRDVVELLVFGTTALIVTRLVAAVGRSEDHWRNAFENNPTMYFMVDGEGTVLSVNQFGAEQLGYRVDELVGTPVTGVFLDEDRAAAGAQLERCLAHLGQSLSWELRKVRKDGTMLWVRETARAVERRTGGPAVLIACEDVTANRQAEARLRESDAQLRRQASLLDLTHDALFVRDLDSVVRYWNRGAEEAYGWRPDEALGQVSHQLLKTEFPRPLDEIDAMLQRTGRWEGELVHTTRDGKRMVMASRWSLQRDAQGQPIGVLETNNDISERKRAAEALHQAQGELARAATLTTMGEFAASIAHELRQPLAAIVMNGSAALRWLNRERPDLGEAREAATRAVSEARRADEVIRGLRALLTGSELRPLPLVLDEVVRDVLELVRGELRQHEISVRTDLAPLPPVLGDRVQLQQVLFNLIVNAAEAMSRVTDRPRALLISTARSELGAVSVAVEDTGPGVEATAAERLFDAFFTTKPSGLGMGLAISRSIVEAHGGQLSVEARHPYGAAFRFTIPTGVSAAASSLMGSSSVAGSVHA